MEPFEEGELSEQELDALLPEWKAPPAPVHLRAAVFPNVSRPWWRKMWSFSVRVPAPVAAVAALLVALAAWRGFLTQPREIVLTERVEVPVFKDRVVPKVVYRDRIVHAAPAPQGPDAHKLRPVAELRPIIIRSGE